ncbi:MAG: HAD-IA family hydrolase [Pseudomonadota bacterium]
MMKLTIFDCDGVLIDSELISCSADAEALCAVGYDITTQQVIERFAGVPHKAMYKIIEEEMGAALPDDFEAQVTDVIMTKYRNELRAIEGAKEVLSRLDTAKCVASSSKPAKLALGLVETGLFELLYPHIFSAALVSRGKPHPDIFLYAAGQMGVDASECLVVEDSVAGVTAARAAGMTTIGFAGASHILPGHADRLRAAGADKVINDLRDLL